MKHRSSPLDHPLVALVLVALAFLAPAGAMGLIEPTETRYAEIAREMRASGDYLTPRLNGLPHFHKPPLPYWSVAAGFAAFGENEWGARVPVALAAVAMAAFVALAVRRRFGAEVLGGGPSSAATGPGTVPDRAHQSPAARRTASAHAGLAVWVLATMLLFFAIARSVASDPLLAAAVAAFWAFAPSPWALAALGAGFMAKGPVVFIMTVLPVLAAALWGRSRATLGLLGPARGWLVFAAVALPWYLVAVAKTPGLLGYFLGDQIVGRYASEVHQRGGPPWYFVAVLIVGTLPWTAALIAGIARLFRARAAEEARLVLCWLFVPLVFLSFSGSKLPSYLLPCMPAAALIAAIGMRESSALVRWTTAALLGALAVALLIAGPIGLGNLVGLDPLQPVPLPPLAFLAVLALAVAALRIAQARAAEGAALVLAGFTALLLAVAPNEGVLGSPRRLAQVVAENRRSSEPLIEYARFNAGLPFYLREIVPMLEVPRDPRFATAAEQAVAIVTRDTLVQMTERHERVWLLSHERATHELAEALGLGYRRVATWRDRELGFVYR